MRRQDSKRMREAKSPVLDPSERPAERVKTGDALTGLYFYAFDPKGIVKERGQVESALGNGHYLVMLLDADEQALHAFIATLDEMRIES